MYAPLKKTPLMSILLKQIELVALLVRILVYFRHVIHLLFGILLQPCDWIHTKLKNIMHIYMLVSKQISNHQRVVAAVRILINSKKITANMHQHAN